MEQTSTNRPDIDGENNHTKRKREDDTKNLDSRSTKRKKLEISKHLFMFEDNTNDSENYTLLYDTENDIKKESLIFFIKKIDILNDDKLRSILWEALWYFMWIDAPKRYERYVAKDGQYEKDMMNRLEMTIGWTDEFYDYMERSFDCIADDYLESNPVILHIIRLKDGDNDWCC